MQVSCTKWHRHAARLMALGIVLTYDLACTRVKARDDGSAPLVVEAAVERLPKQKHRASPRALHSATWTGDGVLIWGGMIEPGTEGALTSGAIYYPASQRWFGLMRAQQGERYHHSAVWTGKEAIMFGGVDAGGREALNNLVIIRPGEDQAELLLGTDSVKPRAGHTAVWTGESMLVWGGEDQGQVLGDGASFDAKGRQWTVLASQGAPAARAYHTAVWTGTAMLVWGGNNGQEWFNSGALYDPKTGTWKAISMAGAPAPRISHTAIWTGDKLLVWGGRGQGEVLLNDGAIYDPASDRWQALPAAPVSLLARELHTAIWTGQEMVIWGGRGSDKVLSDGAVLDLGKQEWRALRPQARLARYMHTAVWTGQEMLVFGGRGSDQALLKNKIGEVVLIPGTSPSPSQGRREGADALSENPNAPAAKTGALAGHRQRPRSER